MRFGGFELHSLSDGFFGLDGGAMFGVVPKPVWERTNPADTRNRIRLAARSLLVVAGPDRILIDTGIGDRWDEKARELYRIEQPDTVESSLAHIGFTPDDITKVVLTHLHFDHAGGTTRFAGLGHNPNSSAELGYVPRLAVPRFPNARHYVQMKEWEAALTPNRRSRASYRAEDFLPVKDAGLLELVNGDWRLDLTARDTTRNVGHFGHVPSLELVLTGGHTPGHQIVMLRSGDQTAIYWGDLVPTRSHIAIPYIMGYDLSPLETMEQKEKLVQQAIAGKWLSFLEHDPDFACGVIEEENGRPFLRPLAE